MKKLLSLSLALLMLLSFGACGDASGAEDAAAPVPDSGAQAQTGIQQPEKQPETQQSPQPEQELRFAEDYDEIYEELLSRQKAAEEAVTRGDVNLYGADTSVNDVVEAPAAEPEDSAGDYSNTNVQVAGIDEGDIVKTDGEYIYILSNGQTHDAELIILKADGASTVLVSRTALSQFKVSGTPVEGRIGLSSSERSAREMFVYGNILAVVYDYWTYNEYELYHVINYDSKNRTIIELYDVSDPEKPECVETLGQDGRVLGTRLYGGRLYVVSSWSDYRYDKGEIKRNEDCIPALYSGENRSIIPAEDICICPHNTSTNFIVAAVYDLAEAAIMDVQTVLGGGSELYMSGENIYILGRAWSDGASEPRRDGIYSVRDYAPSTKTSIFRFSVNENGLSLEAQGLVPGYVESRFSADEHNGYLRMVTTVDGSSYTVYTDEEKGFVNYLWHENDTETNALYILDADLEIVGSVENLAEGERVYSARFDGSIAYFCTFEQVDPLFAVDCSDPKNPVVLSALKISGFSEYLHQWGANQLFGFGYEADESTGWVEGLKMVMFDTTDKVDVVVENSLHLKDVMWSEALYEPHAFFISPEHNIIGFVGDGDYYIYGYSAGAGFYLRAKLDFHGWEYGSRGLYIGDEIYLLGRDGGYVLDLESCGIIKNLYW